MLNTQGNTTIHNIFDCHAVPGCSGNPRHPHFTFQRSGVLGHRDDSSRQQQLSSTAADILSPEAPSPSPAMPRTVRHKSTLRGGAAVLSPIKVGGGAANTANPEKR